MGNRWIRLHFLKGHHAEIWHSIAPPKEVPIWAKIPVTVLRAIAWFILQPLLRPIVRYYQMPRRKPDFEDANLMLWFHENKAYFKTADMVCDSYQQDGEYCIWLDVDKLSTLKPYPEVQEFYKKWLEQETDKLLLETE